MKQDQSSPAPSPFLQFCYGFLKVLTYLCVFASTELNAVEILITSEKGYDPTTLKTVAGILNTAAVILKLITTYYEHVYVHEKYKKFHDDPFNGIKGSPNHIFSRGSVIAWTKRNFFKVVIIICNGGASGINYYQALEGINNPLLTFISTTFSDSALLFKGMDGVIEAYMSKKYTLLKMGIQQKIEFNLYYLCKFLSTICIFNSMEMSAIEKWRTLSGNATRIFTLVAGITNTVAFVLRGYIWLYEHSNFHTPYKSLHADSSYDLKNDTTHRFSESSCVGWFKRNFFKVGTLLCTGGAACINYYLTIKDTHDPVLIFVSTTLSNSAILFKDMDSRVEASMKEQYVKLDAGDKLSAKML